MVDLCHQIRPLVARLHRPNFERIHQILDAHHLFLNDVKLCALGEEDLGVIGKE